MFYKKLLASILCVLLLATCNYTFYTNNVSAVSSPTVTTNSTTGVYSTNATLWGYLNDDGGSEAELTEYYDDTDDVYSTSIYGSYWQAQTFTVGTTGIDVDYYISNVSLYIRRNTPFTSPGNVTLSIRETNITGFPTGSDLTYGILNGDLVPHGSSDWVNFTLTPYKLTSSTKYVLILRAPEANGADVRIYWPYNLSMGLAPRYTGGTHGSSLNSGTTWYMVEEFECLFKVYGGDCITYFQYNGINSSYQSTKNHSKFSLNVSSLTPGFLYNYFAVADNIQYKSTGLNLTFLSKPSNPTNLVLTPTADGEITLNWTHGTGYNKSVVRGKQDSYPSSPTDGDAVYNNTGNGVTHTGLTKGENWYYKVWEYSTWSDLYQFSDNYSQANCIVFGVSNVTTNASTNITTSSAVLNAYLIDDGGSYSAVGFEYGLNTSYENSVISDDYLYVVGTDKKIYQFYLSNLTLKTSSDSYSSTVKRILSSDLYLYVCSGQIIYQLYKSDLSIKAQTSNYGGTINDMIMNNNSIFAVGDITKKINQYWLSNMTLKAQSSTYGAYIQSISIDDDYAYIGGVTTNRVYQFWLSNLTRKAETASFGAAIYSIDNDDTFIYVGGSVSVGKVRQYWKSNLTMRAETSSLSLTCYDIVSHGDYIYSAGSTKYIYKHYKSNMTLKATSPNIGGIIYSLYINNNKIYAGGLTTSRVKVYDIENLQYISQSSTFSDSCFDIAITNDVFESPKVFTYELTDLLFGTEYYYRAFSINEFGRTNGSNFSFWTKPIYISNEEPSNNSITVSLNVGQISFTLNESKGQTMNYTVTTSPNIGSGSGYDKSNGTYYVPISILSYSIVYTWRVTVTNGSTWDNRTFTFTTRSSSESVPNMPTSPSPSSGATNVNVDIYVLSCSVSDPDGDYLTTYFYWSNGTLIGTDSSTPSGSRAEISISSLQFNTTYTWYAIASDSVRQTQSAIWSFSTSENITEITLTPTSYNFGEINYNSYSDSSIVTITNTGAYQVSAIYAFIEDMNAVDSSFSWDSALVTDYNKFSLKYYNTDSLIWTNLNSTATLVCTNITSLNSKTFKLRFSTPTLSEFKGNMTGTLTLRYVGEITRDYSFQIQVSTLLDNVSNIIELTTDNFIKGGIINSDLFYLKVTGDLTTNSTVVLPDKYEGKYLIFGTQERMISSIIVYGITPSWTFTKLEYSGTIDEFKLDISNIGSYNSFVIVPNPGYFQNSQWWFNLLNNAKDIFLKGELL